jgi:lysophospholipid acyltransferase (LPLAT)-like uncharacterized protein
VGDVGVSAERYPWWLEPAAFLGAGVVAVLGRTWRFEVDEHPEYRSARAAGERFVYAFWHSRLLALAYQRRREGIAVLVSRHRDGQLITRVIEHMGFVSARGSSTRGGESGVRELVRWARAGRDLAITPDGPRGPAEEIKDGLAYVAHRLGRRVVPIASSARDAWALRSWDRFRVPRPWSRVCIGYGAPLAVGADVAQERLRLQQALAGLTAATARASGEAA